MDNLLLDINNYIKANKSLIDRLLSDYTESLNTISPRHFG